MHVCVCVCGSVREHVRTFMPCLRSGSDMISSLTWSRHNVGVCMCVCMCVCVCMSICDYVYVCMCVCVCVYMCMCMYVGVDVW